MKKKRYPVSKSKRAYFVLCYVFGFFMLTAVMYLGVTSGFGFKEIFGAFFGVFCLVQAILDSLNILIHAYSLENDMVVLDYCGIPYEKWDIQSLNTICLCYLLNRQGIQYIKMICGRSKYIPTKYPVENGVVYIKENTPYLGRFDDAHVELDFSVCYDAGVLKELLAESGATLFVYQDALKAMSKKDRELLGLRAN